mmetsp:Transcript_22939/g.56526  ORF Transcript_22939/g.56526 Transcript_22939/m.56526 type:complete len:89 (+) Transcript_22939:631-897(+)
MRRRKDEEGGHPCLVGDPWDLVGEEDQDLEELAECLVEEGMIFDTQCTERAIEHTEPSVVACETSIILEEEADPIRRKIQIGSNQIQI